MTSNVRNRAIAHLAFRAGGQPLCKSRRGHIVVAIDDCAGWDICKRCQAKADKMKPRAKGPTAAQFFASNPDIMGRIAAAVAE
ncbi:hypothetical protein [Pseudorhodoplanes sp.]|uniref:hypothetical protein n=1 Tax=Pseudorhodoplanes sp. TaxID=1934341 RepID=UPI002BEBC5A2|nr:hypothetical protein [Pseudorhodoplanes sp.]HWV44082.1 hypothetical protein [Pseudorhodoplanes sp.]